MKPLSASILFLAGAVMMSASVSVQAVEQNSDPALWLGVAGLVVAFGALLAWIWLLGIDDREYPEANTPPPSHG